MELDRERLEILAEEGNVLVCGGPGCGKTTIALLKAKGRISDLDEAQAVLFLSFSRAAVRQISDRMRGVLSRLEQERLEVRTFHSFFIELVRSHGRILNQLESTFVAPDRERVLRSEFSGDWIAEAERRATIEGSYVFDQLAPAAANIVEKSRMARALYSGSSVVPVGRCT